MPDTRDPQAVIAAAEQAALAGDYAAAERLLREAAALQEASLGPLHPELANTLNNLGVVYEVTEKPDEAERCVSPCVRPSPPQSWHPTIRSSPRAGRTSRTFAPHAGSRSMNRHRQRRPSRRADRAPAIEPRLHQRRLRHRPSSLRRRFSEKKAPETPHVAERPSRSLVVPGLVAAALIVAVLIGRMWFGSSEAPPPAAEPAASAPVASPVAAPAAQPSRRRRRCRCPRKFRRPNRSQQSPRGRQTHPPPRARRSW